ncbi:MAG: hypothetical protein IH795_01750 [Bacteroidetes bacterium]|nr:hypothetical protein [Bacteroidota bacterium]
MATEVPVGISPVQFYGDLYRSYLRRSKLSLAREERNWGYFSGVDFKQWNPDALQVLINEKRAPHQINFLQKHIQSLAGNFYQNEFEVDFEPNTGASNDDTLLLKTLYLTDSNRGNWKKARRKLIRGGLIYRGTVEMYIDYKTDPRGSISLRYVNHRRILFDPDWSSDDINDNKHIPQVAWMTAEEIKRTYKTKSAEVDSAVALWKETQHQQGDDFGDEKEREASRSFYDNSEFSNVINGKFLVIQTSRLERGFSSSIIDKKTGDKLPEMSEANTEAMMALRGESLKVVQDEYAKLRVTTIVPGLSKTLVLEDDKMHKIQNGRYQYHTWSAINLDGEVQGVVDVLKDIQEIYNKRESTFTHWQTTSANGAEFVEEDFFANPSEKDRYKLSKNKPGETYTVGAGKLSQSRMGIAVRPRGDMPSDLHVSADRAFQMAPEVGYSVPALSGGEGKSGESAKLFRDKRAQALVSLEPMTKSLQEFEEGLGEAYFYTTKPVYGKAPRIMTNFKTKDPLFLNIPTANGEIINNVNQIRRHDVIVTTSRNGETTRREILERYEEVLQVTSNPIYKSIIEKMMINYLPNIPESEVTAGEEAADTFIKLQISRVMVEIAQNKAGVAQFTQQLEQIGQQAAAQIGGGEGGLPPGPTAPGKTPGEGGGISVEGVQTATGAGTPVDVNNVNQLK